MVVFLLNFGDIEKENSRVTTHESDMLQPISQPIRMQHFQQTWARPNMSDLTETVCPILPDIIFGINVMPMTMN